MPPRRPSQVSRRRRSRVLGIESLEGRQLLATDVAVASDAGPNATPLVRLVDSVTGAQRASVMAFEAGFRGGVRLAMGHVSGSAAPDIVAGSGAGRVAEVRVFRVTTSGGTTTISSTPALAWQPFGALYKGGVEVTVGDVNGDGIEDIVVAKSREGGDVKVFTMTSPGGTLTPTLSATIAKPFGAAFTGGSTVGVADVGEFASGAFVKGIADNKVEILVGSGVGITPRVRVYDVSRLAAPRVADTIVPPFYAAFGRPFLGGVTVTSGRYAASGVADSIDDIVISTGRGGSSQTVVYDGATVATGANTVLRAFSTYGSKERPNAEVRAAAVDTDANGQVDGFLVAQGDSGGPAGIANVSITGTRAASSVTALAGPLRIAAARTVFQTRSIAATTTVASGSVAVGSTSTLQVRDVVTGSGTVANAGNTLTVNYTGMLTDGTVFDSSLASGRTPFQFTLGAGQVIAGWEAGLAGMQAGGRRILVIPPELAYGDAGSGGTIRAGATLVFDVQLVNVTGNSTATINGTSTGALTAGSATATTGGTLTVTDPDAGQAIFATPASLAGTYGDFTFNASTGVWGYTLANGRAATLALTTGQVVSDSRVVTSIDGTASRTITVTVTGANEPATINGASTGALTAGSATATTGGTLTVTDPDAGQAVFATPTSLAGTYGDFTFNATTGAWGYTLDASRAATKVLTADRTVTDSLTATSVDGTASQQIQVTITGFAMQSMAAVVSTPSPSASVAGGSTSSIQYRVIRTGSGAGVVPGQFLTVNYTGMLADGTVFDSSLLPGRPPFQLTLGAGRVIAGWDQGLVGMQVGEKRILVIPPELAYGDAGFPPNIPSGATLTFEVEILSAS